MQKLMFVVLLALFATACGGSDEANPTTSDTDAPATEQSDQDATETAGGGADGGEDPEGAESVEEDPPAPVEVLPVQTRDCAHTLAELGGSGEGDDPEVELPPDEKPEIADEYLVEVDELIATDLIDGTGREAVAGANVEMRYVGVVTDGTEFDSSWNTGQPFSFTLGTGQVIPGWDDGIEGMQVGGRRVLQIPSEQAYGEQARSDVIVANSVLIFIVDLIDVSPPPEPAPPIDDENLGAVGELQIIDLVEGEGCTAEIGDIVSVNYLGVDAITGDEFDSSWGRGVPIELIVGRSQVIEGWNEGLAGMKVGGERILQIPAGMAYDEGDLVFRVHLEGLIEAPVAHGIEFDGPAPSEVEVTTLVEGSGDAAAAGSIVDANIVVMLYKSGLIIQSTYQQGTSTQLALQEGALLPGLEEGIIGTRVGEVRQIVLPPEVAYPAGVPAGSGIEADDAIVFIVEPLRVIGG